VVRTDEMVPSEFATSPLATPSEMDGDEVLTNEF
jgi:hypothetical protein